MAGITVWFSAAQTSSIVSGVFPLKMKYFLSVLCQAGYIRIDGSVPSSERIQLVHKFQSDPETRVAILSIQAAGQVFTHIDTTIQQRPTREHTVLFCGSLLQHYYNRPPGLHGHYKGH